MSRCFSTIFSVSAACASHFTLSNQFPYLLAIHLLECECATICCYSLASMLINVKLLKTKISFQARNFTFSSSVAHCSPSTSKHLTLFSYFFVSIWCATCGSASPHACIARIKRRTNRQLIRLFVINWLLSRTQIHRNSNKITVNKFTACRQKLQHKSNNNESSMKSEWKCCLHQRRATRRYKKGMPDTR